MVSKAKPRKQKAECPKPSQPVPPFNELDYVDKVHPGNVESAEYRAAVRALGRLQTYADGGIKGKLAARLLITLAYDLVRSINRSQTAGGCLVRSLAPTISEWPVLASLRPRAMARLKDELERLRVGERSSFRSDKKARWGESKNKDGAHDELPPATRQAIGLVKEIEKMKQQLRLAEAAESHGEKNDYSRLADWELKCRDLPSLTKKTVPQWWPIMKGMLMKATNDHPERDPHLRPLGEHRVNPYSKRGENRSGKVPEGTREANIREGVFKAIKQAVTSLAQPDFPPS